MEKKFNLALLVILLFLTSTNYLNADFEKNFLNKYQTADTLSFDFSQKIGDKTEFGNCYIKYPLLMKCEYPKKKKIIIANGKKFAVIKKRYKKIYSYPLKKTPLFYLLKKENIVDLVKNYKPSKINTSLIEYELLDNNSNKLKIFFDKNSYELLGWTTVDAYSNEVIFSIKNIKFNIPIKDKIFKIPREEEL